MSKPEWGPFKMRNYCIRCDELEIRWMFFDGCCPSCGATDYIKVAARMFGYWRDISVGGYVKLKHEIRHP